MLYQFLLYLEKLSISKLGITKKLKYNKKNGGITKKKTNGWGMNYGVKMKPHFLHKAG